MNSKTRLFRHAGVPTAILFLAACASTSEQGASTDPESIGTGNYYIGHDDVYAVLVSGSGGSWIFDGVSESGLQPDKGFLVRLNDLAPAFDIRNAECTPQAYPTDHKCNPVHPFREKNVGVLSKIISGGLAAGTAGKVTDVSRTYETTFDETTFNQAVDEALVNSGIDRDRRELLLSIEEYAKLLRDGRAQLDKSKHEADVAYRDTSTVHLDFQPRISGLTEYYTGDLDFDDIIVLVPKSDNAIDQIQLTSKNILPCDARRCLRIARSAIASIRVEVENVKQLLAAREAKGDYTYGVRCNATTHAGYLFRLQCPDEVTRVSDGSVPLPISLEIFARDFDALYPRVEFGDENLDVNIDGDEILFTNTTQNYLSVTAQTVYYNSQVHTNSANISIAPGATVKRTMGEFVSAAIEIESNYRQMTPDKAISASFQFGFAAKYRVASDLTDTTLYEQRAFNVGCVIENRIRPGSCKPSPAKDIPPVQNSSSSVPF